MANCHPERSRGIFTREGRDGVRLLQDVSDVAVASVFAEEQVTGTNGTEFSVCPCVLLALERVENNSHEDTKARRVETLCLCVFV